MSNGRPRPRPAGTGPVASPPAKRGLDLEHLLSAVVGAFVGLVFYSWITPGHLPDEALVERADPKADVRLRMTDAKRGADGLFHVHGELLNGRHEPLKFASVQVKFFDAADKTVTTQSTTVENVAGDGRGPFELRAHVPGAVRFEASLDMAQY